MEGATDERSPSNFNRGNSNRNRSQQNWKKGGNTPVFRPKVQSVNDEDGDEEDHKSYHQRSENNNYSPQGQQSRTSNHYPKFFRPKPPSPVQSGKKQSDTINNYHEPKTPENENKAQQRDFATRSEQRREYAPKNEQKREFTPKNDQRRKSTSEIPVPIGSKSEKPSRRPKHNEYDGTLYNYFVKEGEENKTPVKEPVRRKEEEYYSEEVEASSYPPRREFRNNNRGAQEHKQKTPTKKTPRYDRNQDKYHDQEQTFHQERTPTGRFERTPQDRSHEGYPQERSHFERTPNDRNNEKSPYERKEKSRDKTPKSRNSNGNERTPRTPINSNKNSSQRGTPSSDKKPPKDRFEPHLTETEVEEGLKNGTLYKGVLRINGRKTRDAYATVQGLSQDVYIEGYITRNRALENDIVIVQLYDKSKWKKLQRKDEDDINSDEEEGRVGEEIVEALFEADTIGKKPFELPLDNTEVAKELSLEALKEEGLANSLGDEEDSSESQDEEQIHPVVANSTPVKETIAITVSAPGASVEVKVESVSVAEEKKVGKAEEVKAFAPSPSKAEVVSEEELQPTGKVVAIIERKVSPIQVGAIKPVRNDGVKEDDRFAMFIPSDLKIPKMFVPIGQIPEFYKDPKSYDSKLVKVELLGWKSSAYYPLGKFVGVLGEAGEVNVETEAILVNNEVDFSEFTRDVIDCLPKGEWKIDPEEVKRRRDLREERIFTIDPPTARDLDDALHCKRLPDGNFELGVHIADVSFFVKPGTALDIEARERSTTVYLVQKAIPMLPHMLCENLCSLNPGVDRYAFSVIWKLSPQGEILQEWFGRSIIRSCSKMSYDVAQLIIEGKIKSNWKEADVESLFKNLGPYGDHTVEQMVQDIQNMQSIAVHLRKKRFEGGALAMSNTKLAFKFDETNNPISTYLYVTKEANHLVEEYMLLANERVAEKISRSFPESALLRNHVAPVMRKLENFVKFVGKHVGIELQADCAKSVAESLEKLRGNTEPMMFSALQLLATRSMQLAKYFSTGELEEKDWKHYALNVDRYTHFTSPIRRYPDILVHRLLQAAILKDKNDLMSKELQGLVLQCEELSDVCIHCNDKKLKARKAQEQSSVLYLWLLLKTNLKLTVEAVSLSLGDKYISALLPCFGIEKRLYMEDMQVYKFEFKEGVLTLWWPQSPSTVMDTKGKVSEEILASAILQKINVLSVLPVEVSCKGRMDIALRLLHPKENFETGMYKNSKNEVVIATAWQKNGPLIVNGERTSLLEAEENVD